MVPAVEMSAHFAWIGMAFTAVAAAAALLTWAVTGIVRSFALRNAVLDIPNERSSHTEPTPRGGGAAVVGTVLLCTAVAAGLGWLQGTLAIALLGGGSLIAAVGWLDDRRHVNAAARAAAHIAAAIWTIYWLGGIEYIRLGDAGIISGQIANVLGVVTIAWMTNLYNFMDGIDGLAAVETIMVGVAGAVILVSAGATGLALVTVSLAGAGCGFLVWNRTPARIFMGDVGSGFLGFAFAAVAIGAHKTAGVPIAVWVLLLLAFLTDSTVTLLRRVLRGERWTRPHKLHAYQRLVQSGRSHPQVVRQLVMLNTLLSALAIVVFLRPALREVLVPAGFVLVSLAYIGIERRIGMWNVT